MLNGWKRFIQKPKPRVITVNWSKIATTGQQSSKANRAGWIVFLGMSVLLIVVLQRTKTGGPPVQPATMQSNAVEDKLIGFRDVSALFLTPWLGIIWLLAKYQKSVSKLRLMEQNRNHLRATLFDFDENYLFLENEFSSCRISFAGFERFLDNDKLLILYEYSFLYHVIPKRAFANPSDLKQFKSILTRHVATGILSEEKVFGFAVVNTESRA